MQAYSLWLMPPAPVRDSLAQLISRAAEHLGTPVFEPHVTLSGTRARSPEGLIRSLRSALGALTPIPITLAQIDHGSTYFRCIYARVMPQALLTNGRALACDVLHEPNGDFEPHLSLVYGELSQTDKLRVIAEFGSRLDMMFAVDRAALYRTDGRPETWARIADFTLNG